MTRLQLPLVQRTFRRGLVQWLDAIGRYRSLLADTDDDPAQAAVHRLASGLAGVASTYAVEGLERAARQVIVAPTVRELATRLDELCDAIRREMHPPVERQRRAVVVASADPAVVSRVVAAAPSHLHRVEAFDTIEDARGFVGRTPVGLVVVDLDLDGDPLGWVATLRDDAGTAELPILAVATEGWLRPDALSLGASEFVKRPFASGAVEDAVGGHLGAGADRRVGRAGDPTTGLPGPEAFEEAYGDLALRHHGRHWCVALVAWRNRGQLAASDPGGADDAARSIGASLVERFPEPCFVARLDPDTFGLLIPDAEEERLMVVFEDALHGLALTGGPELDLGIGGVLGLDADYAPVSSTARRMHHLAAIAGQRVLLTTLDELPQRRLLLVEGDADTATSLRSILRGERVEVVYRRTAIEGLEAAAGHAFDLVVLGAGLPNHAAFDVLATLRSWPQYEARPIVLLTSEDAERVAAYDLGADDCVGTPFNPEVLRARLKALLAG